ncbi:MAG: hypothetical protein Q8807_03635, partial ['Waltheria sp.' little leaf phytoplasma]|nr:hypothetical protein ['Waltheria sp.' little leaf phytoplasma]
TKWYASIKGINFLHFISSLKFHHLHLLSYPNFTWPSNLTILGFIPTSSQLFFRASCGYLKKSPFLHVLNKRCCRPT